MKKVRKILSLILLLSVLVYPVKKHMDTIDALFHSAAVIVTQPLETSREIFESKELQGFPAGSLEISASFQQKLGDQKEFFLSKPLYDDALFSQRMIEHNFPLLYNKEAKCGFVEVNDAITLKVVDTIGGYKIVCNP